MKFNTLRKKAVAGFLAVAMLVGSASAITFVDDTEDTDGIYTTYAPSSAISVTTDVSSTLSGATAAANTTVLSILGINVTSTDAAGVYNSAGYNGRTEPINLLMFGSDWNESADPYLAGFYYNLATVSDSDAGGNTYSASDYTNWTGLYTLINYAKSGPTGAANNNTTIDIDVSGTTVNCNPVFYYEPDVLFGSSDSSYDTGLAYYQTKINSSYDPLQVGGWSTSAYCLNDGTFASTVAMCNGVYQLAVDIEEYLEDEGIDKDGRYGSVVSVAKTYSDFDLGLYYYAQSLLSTGALTSVKYCTALTVTTDDNGTTTYTIGTGSGRMVQYADGLGTLVSSGSYTSASALKGAVDVVIASNLTDEQIETLNKANIKVLDSLPDTVYGTTMQSADNGLGLPYVFAFFYEDQLAKDGLYTITTADVTAYWADNLYHIKDGYVDDAVDLMMDGLSESSSYNSTYNTNIAAAISAGATYYQTLGTTVTWSSLG